MPKGLYTRNGIFWARFKVRGIEYRESLHTRFEKQAVKALENRKREVVERVYHGAAEPVSWKRAFVSWNAKGPVAGCIKPSTFDRYVTSIGQLDPWLGEKMLHEIDNKLLKQIVTARQKLGVTNATIRRDMTAVSSVLAHAVDEDWIEDNAARTLDRSRFRERKAKIILPKPDSLAMVLADPSRFMDMARLSLETGMREEEVASLTHDAINRKRSTVTLENTKSGRVREVTLTAAAVAIIDRQPRHYRQRHVFWHGDGERFASVAEQWRNKVAGVARKATQANAAFTPFRFHDLRHLFAVTYLREGRGSVYALQQELGHASIATTERYLDHLTAEEQIAAKHGVAQNRAQVQRSEGEK
jgi:integrase/recombinase XerD